MTNLNSNKSEYVNKSYEQFLVKSNEMLDNSSKDDKFYVLYADIVGFYSVNKYYGFEEGDRLLEAFENYMCLRFGAYYCARIYSDHFVFIVKEDCKNKLIITDSDNSNNFDAFEEFISSQSRYHMDCLIRIACGVAEVNNGKIDAAIDCANIARKASKNKQHSNIMFFDQKMTEESAQEMQAKRILNKSLEEERFKPYFQPIVDSNTGKIVSFEVLVRGVSTDGKLVYPNDFISIFEDNGSIIDLDFLVIRKVCEILSQRINKGHRVCPVSINLSRVHFNCPDTVQLIMNIVNKYNIPANLLAFEFTENVLLTDFNVVNKISDELHRKGFKIYIDDFGTGYSGFNEWLQIPFDSIKLDRSFLSNKNILNNKTKTIITIMKMLVEKYNKAMIICEGVETEEQLDLLHSVGCNFIQGFYFSQAVPAEELTQILDVNKGRYKIPKYKTRFNEFEECDIKNSMTNECQCLANEVQTQFKVGVWEYSGKTGLVKFPDMDKVIGIGINKKTQMTVDELINSNIVMAKSGDILREYFSINQPGNIMCEVYFFGDNGYLLLKFIGMCVPTEDDPNRKLGYYVPVRRTTNFHSETPDIKKNSDSKIAAKMAKKNNAKFFSLGLGVAALLSAFLYITIHSFSSNFVTTSSYYAFYVGALVVFTFCAVGSVALLFSKFRKGKNKEKTEQNNYQILSKFTDTVLFNYDVEKDKMVFSSNAKELISIDSIQINEFSAYIDSYNLSLNEKIIIKNIIYSNVGEASSTFDLLLKRPNSKTFWANCQYRKVFKAGKIVSVIGRIIDIDERKKREENLITKSMNDSLTGVLNKATVQSKVENELKIKSNRGFLFMIDIDDFKQKNDQFGHITGDVILSKIGGLLTNIFDECGFVGRIGGDEFVCFLSDKTAYEEAESKILQLYDCLESISTEIGITVSISVGIASCPKDGNSFEELFKNADAAMYASKNFGKNRYSFA